MPDTMRSLADLATLLADNTTGQISPQDIRDAVLATVQPGHGEISITSSSATTLADTTTWVQAAGTYALSGDAMHWAMTQSGRLYYTGAADRICHVAMSVSLTCVANQQVIEVAVGLDGSPISTCVIRNKLGTGTDVQSTAAHAFTSISTGSYLCLMVRNTTAANNVTAETLNLFAMDMAS